MKRNMDLVRNILLACEDHKHGQAPHPLTIEGFTNEQIGFHVHLMGEAGLLEVAESTTFGSPSPEAIPVSMTWDGYEFLEAARKPSAWATAKSKLASAGIGFSLDLMKELLGSVAREQLGLGSTCGS